MAEQLPKECLMKTTYRSRGFVASELPIVLVVLSWIGLAIVGTIQFVYGDLPWYAWLLGAVVPPLSAIAILSFGVRRQLRREAAIQAETNSREVKDGTPIQTTSDHPSARID